MRRLRSKLCFKLNMIPPRLVCSLSAAGSPSHAVLDWSWFGYLLLILVRLTQCLLKCVCVWVSVCVHRCMCASECVCVRVAEIVFIWWQVPVVWFHRYLCPKTIKQRHTHTHSQCARIDCTHKQIHTDICTSMTMQNDTQQMRQTNTHTPITAAKHTP